MIQNLFSLHAQERYAVVIGNGAYSSVAALNNPGNDARDVAATLSRLGFDVDLLLDADLRTMHDAVRDLAVKLSATDGAVSTFYYAGHGVQYSGDNYLIPIGADIRSEEDLPYEALSVNYVLDHLNATGAAFNMIMLDACRDNPFSTFRSVSRGLAVVQAPRGSIVMYATGAGETAEDGTGRNGTYTAALLRNLETGDIDVHEMVRRVMRDVSEASEGRQVPAFYSNYFGEFSFAGGIEVVALKSQEPPPALPDQPTVKSASVQSPEVFESSGAIPVETRWARNGVPISWIYGDAEYVRNKWWGGNLELLQSIQMENELPPALDRSFNLYYESVEKTKRFYPISLAGGLLLPVLAMQSLIRTSQSNGDSSGTEVAIAVTGLFGGLGMMTWELIRLARLPRNHQVLVEDYNQWAASE